MGNKPYQLFRRKGSTKWYCRFSIPEQGQFQKALKTEDETEADKLAMLAYMRATVRAEQGQSIRERTFTDVAGEFIAKIEKDVANREKKDILLHVDVPTIKRYFIEFFKNKPIDAIKEKDIAAYMEWRKTYWVSGPGKDIKTITYKRAGRLVSRPTPTDRTNTSYSRIRREIVLLKQILKQAVNWGYLPAQLMPEIKLDRPKDSPRPGFTMSEFNKLHKLAEDRLSGVKLFTQLWHERVMIMAYIKFSALSGMRPGEVLNLNFGDILGFEEAKDDHKKKKDIRIRVSKGKTGHRTIVAKYEAVASLKLLRSLWYNHFDREPTDLDPVFFNSDGSRIKSLKKGLKGLLVEAGLEKDHTGARRTAYSFRHFYITMQLIHGVDIYLVAKNAGTSSDMIHRFYGHVELEKMANELRPEWDNPMA
ncbi:MAG: site-specific integrase [Rhodospirillaceae bacterium]